MTRDTGWPRLRHLVCAACGVHEVAVSTAYCQVLRNVRCTPFIYTHIKNKSEVDKMFGKEKTKA